MSRVLGESGDVIPVIANVPRGTFWKRAGKSRIKDEDADEDEDDSVKRLVGEATEKEGVIPKDAEPVDPSETTDGKPLRPVKEIVQEPSHPSGDKEKYLTPYSALTAPDVTPQSTEPIDPSQVPGTAGPEKFTAADLERGVEIEPEQGGDVAAKAMDVLLGKRRASKPATQPGEFEQAGAVVTTEEEAASMLGIKTSIQEAASKAAAAVVPAMEGGSSMPDPKPASDSSTVCSVFRRFNG